MKPKDQFRGRDRVRPVLQWVVSAALALVLISALPVAALRPCPMHGTEHQSGPAPTSPDSEHGHEGHPSSAAEEGRDLSETADHEGQTHSIPCDCLSTCLVCWTPALSAGAETIPRTSDIGEQRPTPFTGQRLLRSTAQLPPPARPPPTVSLPI